MKFAIAGLVLCCVLACAQQRPRLSSNFGDLPMNFEANVGQAAPDVQFLARNGAGTLYLTRDGAQIAATKIRLSNGATSAGEEPLPGRVNYLIGRDPAQWHTNVATFARVRYRNVYPGVDIVYYGNHRQLEFDFIVAPGADPSVIRMHFDGGAQPRLTADGDLLAASITLRKPAVYQDVNGRRRAVAGKFVLSRDGNVGVRLGEYDHAKPLVIDPVLVYSTFLGGSTSNSGGGNTSDVANAVAVDASGNVYVAGATISTDFPVTPGAFQSKLNEAPGFTSAFVTKLNPAGTALIYSTYVGGTDGDTAYGLTIDSAGDAFLVGQTRSKDFPVTSGAFQTGLIGSYSSFVAKLNPTGAALLYGTYLGGTATTFECCDTAYAVAADAAGNAYVTGFTLASGFPVTSGAAQTTIGSSLGGNAYVAKLNPAGSVLIYATYLGGSGQGAFNIGPAVFDGDWGTAIAIDAAGNAYVTGIAHSFNFPVTAGAFQSKNKAATTQGTDSAIPGYNAFVTKINPAGTAFVFSTYLGGSGVTIPNDSGGPGIIQGDQANAIAVDGAGNIYLAGLAYSADFPVTAGAYQGKLQAAQPIGTSNISSIGSNAFVTKMNATGSALIFSTFLGGSGTDRANGLALDGSGNVYLAGATTSTDFPVMAGALQSVNKAAATNNAGSAFVAELNPAGTALLNSTYLGGSGFAAAGGQRFGDFASALALDSAANVYVAGTTNSSDFPATQGAFQTNNKATSPHGSNAFVAKLNFSAPSGGAPSIRPNFGVVDGASYQSTLAAGELATIFGYNLAVTTGSATATPLGTMLGGTQVAVGGVAAPLLYVSPSQINFQVPWEVSGQAQPEVVVTTPSGSTANLTATSTATVATAAPAIFAANSSGAGQGAVMTMAGQIANAANPATRGQYVMIFCTGLGAVSNHPATGAAAAASPVVSTTVTPTVTIGGVQTTTNFSGLAPGFVGLYQVNALVPASISAGSSVALSMSVNGVSSNTVTIAVQ